MHLPLEFRFTIIILSPSSMGAQILLWELPNYTNLQRRAPCHTFCWAGGLGAETFREEPKLSPRAGMAGDVIYIVHPRPFYF